MGGSLESPKQRHESNLAGSRLAAEACQDRGVPREGMQWGTAKLPETDLAVPSCWDNAGSRADVIQPGQGALAWSEFSNRFSDRSRADRTAFGDSSSDRSDVETGEDATGEKRTLASVAARTERTEAEKTPETKTPEDGDSDTDLDDFLPADFDDIEDMLATEKPSSPTPEAGNDVTVAQNDTDPLADDDSEAEPYDCRLDTNADGVVDPSEKLAGRAMAELQEMIDNFESGFLPDMETLLADLQREDQWVAGTGRGAGALPTIEDAVILGSQLDQWQRAKQFETGATVGNMFDSTNPVPA